jgi:putative ABC transport system ATP-binding protein
MTLAGLKAGSAGTVATMIAAVPETLRRPSPPPAEAPLAARLGGISKQYGDVRALENADFRVKTGELVALLGPNRAGKSTAIPASAGTGEAERKSRCSAEIRFERNFCFRCDVVIRTASS